jgi:hypothetical protein
MLIDAPRICAHDDGAGRGPRGTSHVNVLSVAPRDGAGGGKECR